MRIVFMGTPDFALPSLERLIESHHEVVAVVTQPDRKSGRGRPMQCSAVKSSALEKDIEVLQPEHLDDPDFLDRLRQLESDICVVVAFRILPEEVLRLPRLGCINLHPSLLPRYRGAAPINWAIINGDPETGITIISLTPEIDGGAILYQETVPILEDDDAESLGNMLSVLGAERLLQALDKVEKTGRIEGVPQDSSHATRAPKLNKEDGRIDWSMGTERLICLIRGMTPWPGAFTQLHQNTLRILRAEPLWEIASESIVNADEMRPGTVGLTLRSHGFAVRTGDGFLLVTQAQPSGKRAMSGIDLINGKYVKEGDLLRSK